MADIPLYLLRILIYPAVGLCAHLSRKTSLPSPFFCIVWLCAWFAFNHENSASTAQITRSWFFSRKVVLGKIYVGPPRVFWARVPEGSQFWSLRVVLLVHLLGGFSSGRKDFFSIHGVLSGMAIRTFLVESFRTLLANPLGRRCLKSFRAQHTKPGTLIAATPASRSG